MPPGEGRSPLRERGGSPLRDRHTALKPQMHVDGCSASAVLFGREKTPLRERAGPSPLRRGTPIRMRNNLVPPIMPSLTRIDDSVDADVSGSRCAYMYM